MSNIYLVLNEVYSAVRENVISKTKKNKTLQENIISSLATYLKVRLDEMEEINKIYDIKIDNKLLSESDILFLEDFMSTWSDIRKNSMTLDDIKNAARLANNYLRDTVQERRLKNASKHMTFDISPDAYMKSATTNEPLSLLNTRKALDLGINNPSSSTSAPIEAVNNNIEGLKTKINGELPSNNFMSGIANTRKAVDDVASKVTTKTAQATTGNVSIWQQIKDLASSTGNKAAEMGHKLIDYIKTNPGAAAGYALGAAGLIYIIKRIMQKKQEQAVQESFNNTLLTLKKVNNALNEMNNFNKVEVVKYIAEAMYQEL